jgi:hypothetical protein
VIDEYSLRSMVAAILTNVLTHSTVEKVDNTTNDIRVTAPDGEVYLVQFLNERDA